MSFLGFSFGDPGIGGDGSIFVPGASSNPTANPFGVIPGVTQGGILGTGSTSSNSNNGSAQSWLSTIFPWAQLGTQAFLADDAISKGQNLSFNANGSPVVGTVQATLTSFLPLIVIVVVLLIVVSMFKK